RAWSAGAGPVVVHPTDKPGRFRESRRPGPRVAASVVGASRLFRTRDAQLLSVGPELESGEWAPGRGNVERGGLPAGRRDVSGNDLLAAVAGLSRVRRAGIRVSGLPRDAVRGDPAAPRGVVSKDAVGGVADRLGLRTARSSRL